MNRLLLGVMGHVDHGKTALIRVLTGMETDRLADEKRRGISIVLGFAHLTLPGGAVVDLIDMPGHEKFVRAMIAGATGIDAALLIVSAVEGIKPQTVEHVDIAGLLGLRQALIAVTKSDLVPAAQAEAVGRQTAALVLAAGLSAHGPVLTSATTGAGLDALHREIEAALSVGPPPEDDGFPWLPIDRAFSMTGQGTVVTGTLRRGVLTGGAELQVVPGGAIVRARALQVHGAAVGTARPGQRVAVNLRGTELAAVPRGAALTARGLLDPSAWISVKLRAVEGAPPLPTSARLRLLFGTQDVDARLRLLDREELAPGDTALAQLSCAPMVTVPARERFVLRLVSPAQTVAGGGVLDPETTRQRRYAPGVLDRLRFLAASGVGDIVRGEAERAGTAGISLHCLARVAGVAPPRVVAALDGCGAIVLRSRAVVLPAVLNAVIARLLPLLAPHADGLSREALTQAMPGVGAAVLEEALTRLTGTGVLRHERGLVRVYQAARERGLVDADAALAARLVATLRDAGLTPPDAGALAPDWRARRLLDRLAQAGTVIKATDRVKRRDLYFHPDAVAAARRQLAPRLRDHGLLIKEAGELLGISRKFSVPLLEYLDTVNFTRRVADRRVLAKPP